jgi:hypothetical protein
VLVSSGVRASGVGRASIAAVTPGRGGHGQVLFEVASPEPATELRTKPPVASDFIIQLRPTLVDPQGAGQVRVPATVERMSQVNERIYTVLAFDQSGSFFSAYHQSAIDLARRFNRASATRPAVTAPQGTSVFTFGALWGIVGQDVLPRDVDAVLDKVATVPIEKRTRLNSGIGEAVKHAAARQPAPIGMRQVIVFTDGGEESLSYDVGARIKEARDAGVRIHTVIFGNAAGATHRDDLRRIAEETGGVEIQVGDLETAARALEAIAKSPHDTYRVSLEFCGVPAASPVRTDEMRVEFARNGRALAWTPWVRFTQDATGLAIAPCASPPATDPAPALAPPKRAAQPSFLETYGWLLALALAITLLVLGLAIYARARRSDRPRARPPLPAPRPLPDPGLPSAPPAPVAPAPAPLDVQPATVDLRGGADPLNYDNLAWARVLRGPPGLPSSFLINHSPFLIGRDPRCNFVIDAPGVSAKHASFEFDDTGALFLADNNSRNGTFVNNVALTPGERRRISPAQPIRISFDIELEISPRDVDFGEDARAAPRADAKAATEVRLGSWSAPAPLAPHADAPSRDDRNEAAKARTERGPSKVPRS